VSASAWLKEIPESEGIRGSHIRPSVKALVRPASLPAFTASSGALRSQGNRGRPGPGGRTRIL